MGGRVKARAVGGSGPLVSIVLCTFNRAHVIRRAIRSVLAQRYARWQLIIVDDGSTDDTPRLLKSLPLRDRRVIMLRQSNRGLARARNAGLRLAEGEYICFLDSDDEIRPSHLSARVALLGRRRSVDMVFGGLLVMGPKARRYVADLEHPGRKIHVSRCYVGGTFFLRRRILENGFRFRPLAFGEDLDLVRRVQKRHRVERVVAPRTYVYHCEGSDRLCDAYTARAAKRKE